MMPTIENQVIENRAIANISHLENNYPEYLGSPSLDIDIFEGLRATIDDDLLFSDLVTIYLGSAENLIDEIQVAFADQNGAAFHLAAHTLKSTSFSIGAIKLSHIGRYLEKNSNSETISVASELVEYLISEYECAIAQIQLFVLECMAE